MAANFIHINRDLARGLHCIGVKKHASLVRDLPDLFCRLQRSGLIVRHHDRNQLRVRTQSSLHLRRINQATRVHRQNCRLAANTFQVLDRVQHGMVLDTGSDHMIPGLN